MERKQILFHNRCFIHIHNQRRMRIKKGFAGYRHQKEEPYRVKSHGIPDTARAKPPSISCYLFQSTFILDAPGLYSIRRGRCDGSIATLFSFSYPLVWCVPDHTSTVSDNLLPPPKCKIHNDPHLFIHLFENNLNNTVT